MHGEDSESKLLDKEKMNMNYGIMKIIANKPLFLLRILVMVYQKFKNEDKDYIKDFKSKT
jgi:hypothetical protein